MRDVEERATCDANICSAQIRRPVCLHRYGLLFRYIDRAERVLAYLRVFQHGLELCTAVSDTAVRERSRICKAAIG